LCNYCESSNHDAHTYPYCAFVDATCASFKNKINELTDQMIEIMKKIITEYSQCFNQNRGNCSEPDSSLGSPEPAVSPDDDFEPSYYARTCLNEDMYLPSLDQESELPMSLSPDFASLTSSPKDVTTEVLAYPDPPAPFTQSHEFEVGDDLEIPGGLDMSTATEVKPHDFDDSEDIS